MTFRLVFVVALFRLHSLLDVWVTREALWICNISAQSIGMAVDAARDGIVLAMVFRKRPWGFRQNVREANSKHGLQISKEAEKYQSKGPSRNSHWAWPPDLDSLRNLLISVKFALRLGAIFKTLGQNSFSKVS